MGALVFVYHATLVVGKYHFGAYGLTSAKAGVALRLACERDATRRRVALKTFYDPSKIVIRSFQIDTCYRDDDPIPYTAPERSGRSAGSWIRRLLGMGASPALSVPQLDEAAN